jgi:hypothetical protein
VLSRRHVVAIAAVISVVLITLTAWGHKHNGNRRAGAAIGTGQSSASPTTSRPASSASTGPAPATVTSRLPSRTVSAVPSKPRVTARQLTAGLQALFGSGDSFSVAGYDLNTGQSVAAGAGSGMTEASIVKLDILQTALYRQQTGVSDYDDDDVADMIEHSDNAAADRVYVHDGGNSGLQRYNDLVGLGHTALDPTGAWGLSTTAASDELLLLKQLTSRGTALSAASRNYALQLMANVEADQRWGISAAADPGATSWLKNGWLSVDRDHGLWTVNSVGITTAGGHRVLLAVLSQHQPDFQTGVNRVAAAAKQLAAALQAS